MPPGMYDPPRSGKQRQDFPDKLHAAILAQLLGVQRQIVPRGVPPFLAGIDLFRGGKHLLPADALIRRAEKALVDTADLRCLAQQIPVIIRDIQLLGQLAGNVVAAAAGLSGNRNDKMLHKYSSSRTQIGLADPVVLRQLRRRAFSRGK